MDRESFAADMKLEVQDGAVMLVIRGNSGMDDWCKVPLVPEKAREISEKLRLVAHRAETTGRRVWFIEGLMVKVAFAKQPEPPYVYR